MAKKNYISAISFEFETQSRELSPEGYLRAKAILSRTGISYWLGSEIGGDDIDENRAYPVLLNSESLFANKSITSFKGKPITLGHPPTFTWAGNSNHYSHGHICDDVRQENNQLVSTIVLTSSDAVNAVLSEKKSELSIGFIGDLKREKGSYNSEEYEFRFIGEILGNHVALVEHGKMGPEARVMDKKDQKNANKENNLTTKNAEKESSKESNNGFNEDKFFDKLKVVLKSFIASKSEKPSESKSSKDKIMDKVKEMANKRIKIIRLCQDFLPEDFDVDKNDDIDILKAACKELKINYEKKDETYMVSMLEAQLDSRERASKQKKEMGDKLNNKKETKESLKNYEAARKERIKKLSNNWKH